MIEKVTLLNLVANLGSTIVFDVAPNHTGVVWYNGNGKFTEYGFAVDFPDTSDIHWESKLRHNFKLKLMSVIPRDTHFQNVVIEGIFGGENFRTTQELININCILDELLLEGYYTCDNFYRWTVSEWQSRSRLVYKQPNKLKSKIETQGLLEYLDCAYYKCNCNKDDATLKKIFFEDICDCYGMFVALIAELNFKENIKKKSSIKLSDIKMYYYEDTADSEFCKDKRIQDSVFVNVDLNFRNIEASVKSLVEQYPNNVLCAHLPVNKLGIFGTKNKFKFYQSGEGYLIFYLKA